LLLSEEAARLRARAAEYRALAKRISYRPDREILLQNAGAMEAQALRIERRLRGERAEGDDPGKPGGAE
jgi:hypothetical protein